MGEGLGNVGRLLKHVPLRKKKKKKIKQASKVCSIITGVLRGILKWIYLTKLRVSRRHTIHKDT